MGSETCPGVKKLMITADGGGSNSSGSRLWKKEIQDLATATGLEIHIFSVSPKSDNSMIYNELWQYFTMKSG